MLLNIINKFIQDQCLIESKKIIELQLYPPRSI